MLAHFSSRSTALAIGLMAVLAMAMPSSSLRAAEPKAVPTSASKVPGDVELYSASLRMGETMDLIAQSRAWKQIWDEPMVKMALEKAKQAYTDDASPLKKFLDDPENKDLPGLALDAVSNEIFAYAGSGSADLLALAQEMQGSRSGAALQKLAEDNNDPQFAIRFMLQTLSRKPERVRIPNIVFGMKVSDSAKVNAQLKRLDPLLADALKDTPLKGRSQRVKVGADEFLVLKLDGSLVPWEMLPIAMYEEKEGEFAPLMKRLKSMKLTIAIGVRQGYLLVGIGETVEHLTAFGGTGAKLIDRPELKPIVQAKDKPITSISYTSRVILNALEMKPEDVKSYAEVAKIFLKKSELPDEQKKAIEKDLDKLATEIGATLKPSGAHTSFSFRTATGWETFAYDYTPAMPESRPLAVRNHLGANPLCAIAGRSPMTVEDYRTVVKWVTIAAGHIEKAAITKNPDAEAPIMMFREKFLPSLIQLNTITEKFWLPALEDGQIAMVLDAKWTSKRWNQAIPETDRELPMIELGIVLGVSDAEKLKSALEQYRTTINTILEDARAFVPIPPFEITKPVVEKKGGNTYAHYPIPEEFGFDAQVRPTAGLSPKIAALTLSKGHTERLLTISPLDSGMAPLADAKKPIISMIYFNWAGMVDAMSPWVGWGLTQVPMMDNKEEVARMATKTLAYLKIFRGYASVTYREGAVTVTHSEAVFKDIEP